MNLRLQKIDGQIKCINEMCNMMSLDLKKTLYEVHPSFVELERIKAMSISDSTLDRLAGKVHALNQEKKQRLRKLQDLGSTLIELLSLMDTPLDEQKCFDHVTSLISVSPNTVIPQGCLAHDLIDKWLQWPEAASIVDIDGQGACVRSPSSSRLLTLRSSCSYPSLSGCSGLKQQVLWILMDKVLAAGVHRALDC